MRVTQLGDGEVVIAVECIKAVRKLDAGGREGGVFELQDSHLMLKPVEEEHRGLQHAVGDVDMIFHTLGTLLGRAVGSS